MPAKRGTTQQVNWRVDSEALEFLTQLEPQTHRRGQYVSSLIRAAAERAGLVEKQGESDLVELQRQLQELQDRVATALEQQRSQYTEVDR